MQIYGMDTIGSTIENKKFSYLFKQLHSSFWKTLNSNNKQYGNFKKNFISTCFF